MTALNETDRLFFDKTGMNKRKVTNTVTSRLHKSQGGELYLEKTLNEFLGWSQGRISSNSSGINEGFGIRFITGERSALVSDNEFSESVIMQAANKVKSAKHLNITTSGSIHLPKSRIIKPHYRDINPLLGLDDKQKIKLLSDIDGYIRAQDSRVRQVNIGLSGEFKAVQIIRADGHRVADIRPLVRLNIGVVVEQNGRMESGVYGLGGRMNYSDIFNEAAWKNASDAALKHAINYLDSVPAPVGEMTVVLGSGWPGIMLHEAVGHGLEGDSNRIGASVFSDRVGEKVAPEWVTVIDQGNLPDRRGSLNFDDEGIKTQKTILIEKGILKGYMQDTMNAHLMGVEPTGNGRRESFDYKPIPRMTNTFMEAGKYDPQEIIESVKDGIYAPNFGGGQVDPVNGQFVFEMSEAYLIKNGKITGAPLKGATLLGNSNNVIQQVRMVGNDLALDPGVGNCGKARQSVPVSVGQPTVRLDGLTIGGG